MTSGNTVCKKVTQSESEIIAQLGTDCCVDLWENRDSILGKNNSLI